MGGDHHGTVVGVKEAVRALRLVMGAERLGRTLCLVLLPFVLMALFVEAFIGFGSVAHAFFIDRILDWTLFLWK